jgi:hypothetical protein
MKKERLQLALERLTSSDWRRLELYASEFLVSDFPNLRTTANPSGDGGRDAEILMFKDDPTQVLQYSVTPNWATKIRGTVRRLNETNPSVQFLTYVTNVQIGAEADVLKAELRHNHKIYLDVRDNSYFLDRFRSTTATENASEQLAADLVDPLLAEAGVIKKATSILSDEEARAALLLLSLQLKDDIQEKGLTKLSFDALVRSALVNTSSENRMPKQELFARVAALLPHDASPHTTELIANAIDRLKKKVIRHYTREDEYCLTHEESSRVHEYKIGLEIVEAELQLEIHGIVRTVTGIQNADDEVSALTIRTRRILERVLYDRAELFASAVVADNMGKFASVRVKEVVLDDQNQFPAGKGTREADPDIISTIIREVLISKSFQIEIYLRELSDAYTLMAFLRETPDVQNAIRKIFSRGEIYLDTTVLLPILAEELIESGEGEFQRIVIAASTAGIEFYVTDGVIEELSSHILKGLAYARGSYTVWEGSIPFIFEAYVRAGRDPATFTHWIENFMGDARPIEDLGIYLKERFGIQRTSLEEEVAKAPVEFRQAVDQIWQAIHEQRREKPGNRRAFDPLTLIRLAKHDTENYVGVVQKRQKEISSPLGYSAWWLTFDRLAFTVADTLRTRYGITPPPSPIISLDFLAQSLTMGSIRPKLSKESARSLPLMIEPRTVSFLTKELLDEAKAIRKEMEGTPEHIIARRVRDHLDAARQRMGPMAVRGVETFYDELEKDL